MGIGVGVFLVAIGAILAFALDIETSGVDLDVVGVILMIVGVIGVIASFLLVNDTTYVRRRRVYYDDADDVERRPRRVREQRTIDEY